MKKATPVIVSVFGWSNSGKTTFIEAAIAECARRGISTAAIKKSHNAPNLTPSSKDSSRFRQAGAEPSIYLCDAEMLILSKAPSHIDNSTIISLCPGVSIIFCEGLDVEGAIRVLASGNARDESSLKRTLADIDILIARNAFMLNLAQDQNVKFFKPEEIAQFIDHLIAMEASHE
jgi:molybdopterin-guanine dinucleotide biosynthesis protein MobB